MPSVAEPVRTATNSTGEYPSTTPDGRFIVRAERYGYSIEVRDANPQTRFLPPPDSRSILRRFFDRLWLGMRPYRSQLLPILLVSGTLISQRF
jgi:hypothetical protein